MECHDKHSVVMRLILYAVDHHCIQFIVGSVGAQTDSIQNLNTQHWRVSESAQAPLNFLGLLVEGGLVDSDGQ